MKDRKCKSNQEDRKYKYCEIVDQDGLCKKWVYGYNLGEDNKCCNSQNCVESEK